MRGRRLARWQRALHLAQARLVSLGERRCGTRSLPFTAGAHLLGALGALLATGNSRAVDLPEDRADVMYHSFNGGGVDAWGPALLVRKGLYDKVSLFGTYYADIVSNASIDVVTTASPYRETRNEFGGGLTYAVRNSLITLAASRSDEPDYIATAYNIDVATETFGGMTTVGLGYTYASDDVGKKDEGFFDHAKHWRYRLSLNQILTPRWMATANFEVVSDDGYLGSPYRVALVFGAAVPERVPRTRTSRSALFRVVGEVMPETSVRADYRYFWDTWDIASNTFELGATHRFGERWLADAFTRFYSQDQALFYSNNATTETQYVSRNRQLSQFSSWSVGGKLSYALYAVPGRYEMSLTGAVEYWKTNYDNFTDIRTGELYSYGSVVSQVFLTVVF